MASKQNISAWKRDNGGKRWWKQVKSGADELINDNQGQPTRRSGSRFKTQYLFTEDGHNLQTSCCGSIYIFKRALDTFITGRTTKGEEIHGSNTA